WSDNCAPTRAASAVHFLRGRPVAAFRYAATRPACVHPPCRSCSPPLIRHCGADCRPELAAPAAAADRIARPPRSLLPRSIQDGDHNRFLVHVHSDIFDVVTHLSCLLGGKVIRANACFPPKVKCHSPANLPRPCCSFSAGHPTFVPPPRAAVAERSPCTPQRSGGGATSSFHLLKRGALS